MLSIRRCPIQRGYADRLELCSLDSLIPSSLKELWIIPFLGRTVGEKLRGLLAGVNSQVTLAVAKRMSYIIPSRK